MTFRECQDDRDKLHLIRLYLQMVMGRDRLPSMADAIRYALRLAADAVTPIVVPKEK